MSVPSKSGAGSAPRRIHKVSEPAASRTATITERIESSGSALTGPELARLLGIHRSSVFRLAITGRLPHYRVAGVLRFDPVKVADWLRDREIPAA